MCPLVVAFVPLFWVVDATKRAALTTLGRDQGIFQYIAWAVSRGEVDYRDVRDVNGPLIHLLHWLSLRLGGGDEYRFHQLDLLATGLSFAFVGACIPGVLGRRGSGWAAWLERAAWAFAAWVVLAGQYQLYTYWNQAQRESFCDWFLLPSLALQLLPPPRRTAGLWGAGARLTAVFALSVITWFGKPTFVVFTVFQAGLALYDGGPLGLRTKLRAMAIGAAIGALPPLAYVFAFGDAGAFLRISLVDVPQVYRFIWAKSAQEILGEEGALASATLGLASSALVVALVWVRELPRRALVIGLAPLAGLLNVLAQHKGFDYHFHPLTAAAWTGLLVVLARLAQRARSDRRERIVAIACATALAAFSAWGSRLSPQIKNVWILAGGETAELRTFPAYFGTFRTPDYFPWELREAAAYLERVTAPNARVQTYGMDPYLLFLAGRRSATPYIYAYDLDANAALEGGWSSTPTDAEAAVIRAKRDAHEADMLARLEANPPEAFVFLDHAPLMTYQEAWEDFRTSCTKSAQWVAANYHPARSFGGEVHVWLKDGHPVKDELLPPGAP